MILIFVLFEIILVWGCSVPRCTAAQLQNKIDVQNGVCTYFYGVSYPKANATTSTAGICPLSWQQADTFCTWGRAIAGNGVVCVEVAYTDTPGLLRDCEIDCRSTTLVVVPPLWSLPTLPPLDGSPEPTFISTTAAPTTAAQTSTITSIAKITPSTTVVSTVAQTTIVQTPPAAQTSSAASAATTRTVTLPLTASSLSTTPPSSITSISPHDTKTTLSLHLTLPMVESIGTYESGETTSLPNETDKTLASFSQFENVVVEEKDDESSDESSDIALIVSISVAITLAVLIAAVDVFYVLRKRQIQSENGIESGNLQPYVQPHERPPVQPAPAAQPAAAMIHHHNALSSVQYDLPQFIPPVMHYDQNLLPRMIAPYDSPDMPLN